MDTKQSIGMTDTILAFCEIRGITVGTLCNLYWYILQMMVYTITIEYQFHIKYCISIRFDYGRKN